MKTMAYGDVRTHFSKVLEEVELGKRIGVLRGRSRKPVAVIVPYALEKKTKERKIGILDGKAKIKFEEDFAMTTEEFLDAQ